VDDFRQVIDLDHATSDDTLRLARTAAEAIRGLNWLTRHKTGLGQPSIAYDTTCRRGGALALTPHDLDPEQCLIRLREKGETVRWQPVSPTLMRHLLAHGESRSGLGSGQRLLRYANGRPITKKRYEHLWRRLGEHLA